MIEKEDRFVRFHALQSIALAAAAIVISIGLTIVITILGAITQGLACVLNIVWPFFWLACMVVFILMMVKAYQGETYKLPVLGDMVEKYV